MEEKGNTKELVFNLRRETNKVFFKTICVKHRPKQDFLGGIRQRHAQ
jgi:hypothetical protein